jgi:hypothetical protein
MNHRQYLDVCARTEHKDQAPQLRNLLTGETGRVLQCSGWDTPEAILVSLGDSVITWTPQEVEEVEGRQ